MRQATESSSRLFFGEMLEPDLTLDTIEVESVGDWACEVGAVRVVGANSQVTAGRYVVVRKRQNGLWKIHRDIWNSAH